MSIHNRNWRGRLALCAATLALFLLSSGLSNAAGIRISLAELSARSPLIVHGRVERIESERIEGGVIESDVYIRLIDVPRGGLSAGALIPVRVSGGIVDGVGMVDSEEAVFNPGEQVYLFLTGLRGNAYRVVAGKQGKYEVVGDRAVNRAWRQSFPLAELNAGALGNRWPAEPATPRLPEQEPEGGLAESAAAPEGYVYNDAKWFGSSPMGEKFYVNLASSNAGGSNGSVDAFLGAIQAAANTWNNAGSRFRFEYGGTTGNLPDRNDGQNVIGWANLGASNTLAVARWWFYRIDNRPDQIFEADITFNTYYVWDATSYPSGNEPDLQSIATHELGHWLSLSHDNDPACNSCPATGPVMCACYQLGSKKRSLASNDAAGIRAIYGEPAAPPTATPTRTPTPRPTLRPDQIKGRQYLPLVLKGR